MVVDGTGATRRRADVAVENGLVAEAGRLKGARPGRLQRGR